MMESEGSNVDEDTFLLGSLNAGNQVSLALRLPDGSSLDAGLTLLDSSGAIVGDDDGLTTDSDFATTLATGGTYYARLTANSGAGSRAQYLLDVSISDTVPPQVVQVLDLPASGSTATTLAGEFRVAFDEDLFPSTVTLGDAFDLRAAGEDATFGTADDIVYGLQVAPAYSVGNTVTLSIGDQQLADGEHQLTMGGVIADVAGNNLDGNGDGIAADSFVHAFTIATPSELFTTFESEPNNGTSNATTLSLADSATVSGFSSGVGIGVIDQPSDSDYWKFEADATRER
jgi:hypothetical protein